ncbi:hypothetical protein [Pseudomonas faucium]|uniref:hypothetical protein n=1 Tax=Pseudomonas faucium TaxID=2740518 RepID=UPI0039C140E7
MSNIHDQAMHYIYQQVLERLLAHMSQPQRASLQLLIQRLLLAAGGPDYIGTFRLLVVQGADTRSTRLLAILRAAQLSIALRAPMTFQLQVRVVGLPAASGALLQYHERNFDALFMHDDPRVDLQMVNTGMVEPFNRQPRLGEPWPLARDALLLFGHLADARPEALLGSRLHLELAAAVGLACEGQPCADALVTAMPLRQRRRYLAWARRSLRLAGDNGLVIEQPCLAALAERLGQLHGLASLPVGEPQMPGHEQPEQAPLRLLAIDDLLPQLVNEGELDRMIGHRTEPAHDATPLAAYLDPLALTQLQELHARCLAPSPRREALRLVGQRAPGSQPGSQQARFTQAYGIDQAQLICMLYGPFAERGRGLERFLRCRHPDMLVALPYLHRALQGKTCPDAVKHWLVNTSGLALGHLRAIYGGRLHSATRRLLTGLARRDVQLRWLAREAAR